MKPIISVFRRIQKDLGFKVILYYATSGRLDWATFASKNREENKNSPI